MLAKLIDNPDRPAGEREAVLMLSVLVGAISMARAVDEPALSQQILTNAARALKERIQAQSDPRTLRGRRVRGSELVVTNDR